MQKILLSLIALFSLNIIGMELVDSRSVSSAQDLKLWASQKDLFVENDNAAYRVEHYNMNPLLREVMKRQARGQFTDAGYIRVKQLSEGKYALEAKVRGDGGGLIGTNIGCYVGKFTVHFVAHGTIIVISSFSGPAAPATAAALEATFALQIEAASNIGAIAGGLIGGLWTGPV